MFKYVGKDWHTEEGRLVRNYAKVFLITAEGRPKPRHEIKYIDFWKPDSKIKISSRTEKVIREYLELKKLRNEPRGNKRRGFLTEIFKYVLTHK